MMSLLCVVFFCSEVLILFYGVESQSLDRSSELKRYSYRKKVVTETFYKNGNLKKRITDIIEQSQQKVERVDCSESSQAFIKTDRKPNIVLIMADDLGWNDVGWQNPDVITPNMDNLARQGIILKNSYVQPICTPSRAALLTGKYPHRLGLQWLVVKEFQSKVLPRNETLLSEKLKQQGYSTHIVGKWHLGHCNKDVTPTYRGFDSFYGILRGVADFYNRTFDGGYDFWKDNKIHYPTQGSYNTDLFTEQATEIIEKSSSEIPLFLYLPLTTPHFPLQAPKMFKAMYPNITDPNRKTYLGMVSSLDKSVGRVVTALEKKHILNNTIIIFMSDNGGDYHFGASNSPLRGDKGDLYEGGTKSAGFVYSPLLSTQGCVHSGLIHVVDWFPTILEIAGYPLDHLSNIDGISQWKYLKKCRGSGRKEMVYGLDDDISKTASIRYGRYKLILGDPEVYGGIPPVVQPLNPNSTDVRLYDLQIDPLEKNNLATRCPRKVNELKQKLDKYRIDSIPAQNQPYMSKDKVHEDGLLQLGWC